MPIVVDLDDVVAGGPPPLEEGYHDAVITKAEIHPSKRSQEDTLYLDLAVGEEGRRMQWNTSMQPQTLGRFKQLLERLDFEIPEGEFEFDEANLVGVECRVYLTVVPHYSDPERKTNRITGIYGEGQEGNEEGGNWG